MATKSITKTVNIKTASSCRKLINALERSESCTQKPVQTRSVENVRGSDIKKLFGVNK